MTIVQAPHTSSRQLQSQATGATCVVVDRVGHGGNPLQHADHVHVALVRHAKTLPITRLARAILPEHANIERIGLRGMTVVRVPVGALGVCGMIVVRHV